MQERKHHVPSTVFGIGALILALFYLGGVAYTTGAMPSIVDFIALVAGLLMAAGGYRYKGNKGSNGAGPVVCLALVFSVMFLGGCATDLDQTQRLRNLVENHDRLDESMMDASRAGQLPKGLFISYHKISKEVRTKNIEGLKTLLEGRNLDADFFENQGKLMQKLILKELSGHLLKEKKPNGANRSSNINGSGTRNRLVSSRRRCHWPANQRPSGRQDSFNAKEDPKHSKQYDGSSICNGYRVGEGHSIRGRSVAAVAAVRDGWPARPLIV